MNNLKRLTTLDNKSLYKRKARLRQHFRVGKIKIYVKKIMFPNLLGYYTPTSIQAMNSKSYHMLQLLI